MSTTRCSCPVSATCLSISGYHMAVVAGVVFFVLRALLALIPGLADRAPVKKWSAFAALLVTAFYLVLSGAEVATQRSFIMIAIVLIGVMLDRPILTLRTVTIAALVVLLFAPEAVVHPSFQMSFAATLALIAAYAHGLPLMRAGMDSSLGARAALWGVNEVDRPRAGLAGRRSRHHALCGLSLSPSRALWRARQSARHAGGLRLGDADGHSRRARHSVWLRRRVLAADGLRHRMDGCGGALGREPAGRLRPRHVLRHRAASAGDRGASCSSASSRRRCAGAARCSSRWPLSVAARTPRARHPGRRATAAAFAVRGADGRLAFHHTGGDTFAIQEWLAADADGRNERDPKLGAGIACDPSGCIGKLADGRLVSYVLAPDAFEEDCRRAAVIVATRDPPPDCAAMVIGASFGAQRGALTLRADGTASCSKRRVRRISTGRGRARREQPRQPTMQAITTAAVTQRAARRDAARGGFGGGGVILAHSAQRRIATLAVLPLSQADDRKGINTAGTIRPACPECARGWAAGCAPRRRCWRVRARSKRRGGGNA